MSALIDTISSVMDHVGVRGSVFCRAEVGAPWGLHSRALPRAIFHVIVRGAGFIRVEGADAPVSWRAADVLLLPRGHAHTMSDGPRTRAVSLSTLASDTGDDGLPCVRHGGDGPSTSILCGTFEFGEGAEDLLLSSLPPLIHVQGGSGATSNWLDATIRMLAEETQAPRPGTGAVVGRLAEVLLVYALRTWIASAHEERGWLTALRDPLVARALAAMHSEPSRNWTTEDLAREVGASRSSLHARFADALDETPAAYLARWRMQVAGRALESGQSLAEVAKLVGYQSEAAFSRAFKRIKGCPPTKWRRESPSVSRT